MSKEGDGAEEALSSREQELRLLVETIPALVWRAGPEGNVEFVAQLQAILNVLPAYTWYAAPSGGLTFVNKRTADYLGLPKDHPLRFGIDIGAQWDARSRCCIRTTEKNHAKPGQTVCARARPVSIVIEFVTLKETIAGSSSRRTAPGRRWNPSAVGRGDLDIEELKRAEQALRESEAKFRDYAETASDWFWEIGPDYKFTLLTENAFGSRPGRSNRHGVLGSRSRP